MTALGFTHCLQDSCYHVRLKIAAKLHKGLVHLRLPLEYMSIFSLAANDPLRERRAFIKKCIQINVQKRREYLKQNPQIGGTLSHLSRLMGKPTICICENKGADQLRGNREADQRLCFRYLDNTFPPLLNSKISSF